MTSRAAFAFSRRRFLALASGLPALLLTRCAPLRRDTDEPTYYGPFFSDGSDFAE
ncbi:MAG: hypothetical protein ACM30I_02305 [Gemmatimonas sp.]